MFKYKLGEDIFNVPAEEVDIFEMETPDAIRITDEITDPEEGKTNGVAEEGATVTPKTGPAPEIIDDTGAPEVTGFKPVESSLGSKWTDNFVELEGIQFDDGAIGLGAIELEGVTVTADQYKKVEQDIENEGAKQVEEQVIAMSPGDISGLVKFLSDKGNDLFGKPEKAEDISTTASLYGTTVNSLVQLSGVDDRANYVLSAFTNQIPDNVFLNILGEDAGRRAIQANRDYFKRTNEQYDYINSLNLPTLGFTDIGKKEGLSKVGTGLAATLNGISAFATSAATSVATGGVGLATDIGANAIKSFNDTKAQSLGLTSEELFASGQGEILIPSSIAVLQFGLERIGIKKVGEYFNKLPAGKTKGLFSMLNVGNAEAIPEYLQGGLDIFNEGLAQGLNADDVSVKVLDYLTSPDGIENYLQGLVGGAGVAGVGSAARKLRTNKDNEAISKIIRDLNDLENSKFRKNLTAEDIAGINTAQEELRFNLTQIIDKSNALAGTLSDAQIEELNTNSDFLTSSADKINEIEASDEFTQKDKEVLLQTIEQQREVASQNIFDIRSEAEKFYSNLFNVRAAAEKRDDIKVLDFANADEIQTYLNDNPDLVAEGGRVAASGEQGFFIPGAGDSPGTIIINREKSLNEKAVNVASHEFLHYVLDSTLKNNPAAAINLGNALLKELDKIDVNKIKDSNFKKRMELYKDEKVEIQMEEALTLFSDALATGDIQLNEDISTMLGDRFRRVLGRVGVKVKFNKGSDVVNFVKDFNKSLEKGVLTKAQQAVAQEGAEGELIPQAEQQADEQIIKESRSEEASQRVQEIYDQQGTAGSFEIIEQFKPITSKLVERRSEAPGFDRQLLTDEIETGQRGIIDLISEYDPDSGVPLAAYINKFLPARAIEASNRILGEEFTEDVTEARGVVAEETDVEVTEKPKGPRKPTETTIFSDTVLNNLGVENKAEAEKQISDATSKAFEGQDITRFGQTKNVPVAVAEIYGKMFGVNPETIYDKKRNYSKKDAEGLTRIKQYLIDNAASDFARLPRTKDDFGKATFIPNNVMNALYTDGELTGTLKDYLDLIREKPVKPIYRDRVGQTIRGLFNTSIRNRMVEDIIPSKPERARAGAKFSKAKAKPKTGINAEIETIVGGRLPFTPEGNQEFRDFLAVELPKYLGKDVTKIIKPGDVAGAGNSAVGSRKTSGAIGRGFRFIGNRQRTQQFIPETDQALEANEVMDLEVVRKEIDQAVQLLSPEQVKDINAATSSQTRASMKKNEANKDSIKRGRRLVLDALFKAVQADPKNIIPIRELLYNQNANTSFGRKFATVISTETNLKPKENTWEEHVYQFGNWAKRTLQAFKTGDPNIVNNWLQWADDNYYQEVTGKPTQAVVDGVYEGWKAKAQEHPYLKQSLDEAFKTGDFSKVPSSDIRKYNEFFTLNPNIRTRDGITDAQRYNVEVPASLQNNKAVVNEQGKLIYQQLIGYITPQQAKEQIQEFSKLAPSILKASKSNNKKLPPGIRLEDPGTFDQFGMVDVVTKQMFPAIADLDVVKAGRLTAYEALDPDQQFEVMAQVPGSPVQEAIAVMSISDQAIRFSRNADAPNKGISVWDFDDTLATTKSNVLYTMPDGTKGTLTAEQFAKQGEDLLDQGAEFDFSEFEKVTKGAKGPMFEKAVARNRKFGNDNVFILTARTQAAAEPIHQFLKAIGLDIPLRNIVGLGNSTPEAKARWVVGKAAEGYNDFYFADDAYKNVKAVQDALSVLDVKSKVRQAYVKHSKSEALDKGFNDILEQTTGIASEKEYKKVKAEVAGASRGRVFRGIPYSAQDFVGLLYETLSKGKLGDSQMAWYKEHLIKPYARAMNDIDNARLNMMQDYRALKKQLGVVPKDLRKKVIGEPYTREQAVRVYIWNKQGTEVPGISKQDLKDLTKYVQDNAELQVFADQIIAIQKGDQYASPQTGWPAGSITTDILRSINTGVRAKYLQQWQDNVDVIFSEKNMNKLEAAYGKPYRKAMENMLQRMKTGRNRTFSDDSLTGRFTDWLQGSIGTIMFFNTRSALLQTISSVNFINFTDNNPLAAARAFANQKQYWSDFMTLINSDFLKARRSGLRFNVTEADIANMAKEGGPRAVVNRLLQLGFAPTQIADSFAIASGGATFYRNRIKSLMKQGMSKTEAEAQAFENFRENAEESQQSARPDRISMQQAGPLGRLILAFANTPAQYARLTDKAIRDLKNNRGDAKTNISKIIYYTTVQNLIFNALQQAIFALAFDDEEPEDEEKKDKYISIANGMADSLLRGTGFAGAAVSVGKNAIIRVFDEMEKKQPKLEKVGYELTKISPPISAKLSRINQAARSYQWDKDEMINGGWGLDNPAYLAAGNVVSALTNVPIDRGIKKMNNIVKATDTDLEAWERLALIGGWQDWEIGLGEETKQNKPQPRKTKRKVVKKRKVIKK
tara:strand:+ start:5448 stop:12734 length:7287 start_codon:yes stop_codon:yes gene_type:complete